MHMTTLSIQADHAGFPTVLHQRLNGDFMVPVCRK